MAVKRKLIEVSIPLDAINKNSAVEKNVRSGHPSTLHLWWARRPLAAARAVLFAQLVDDPSSHPERFPDEAAQSLERDRLHALIEELSDWENSNDEDLLRRAAQEIATSVGTDAITLLDPFAGGGTIPLEAKRLGLSAHANDLNPLPVLLNNVMLQLVDRFTLAEPVTGGAPGRQAEMLAQDLRVYAELLEADAADRVHENYPAMPDGSVPLVYFWARTVTCPNPACRIETPLVNSWRLSGRRGAEAHMSPVVDLASRVVNVEIVHGSGAEPDGTLSRTGGICVNCGSTIPLPYIKAQGVEHGLGARLLAMQVRVGKSRFFVVPDDAQRRAASIQAPDIDWLDAELSTHSQYMAPPRYGMTRFKDLFSARQLTTLNAFVDGLDAVQKRAEQDAYDEDETHVRIENLSHFDRQFSGICRRCNNEWLREIDVAAKDVALDLALRHRAHVSANEVVTLASSLYRAGLIGMWGQRQQHGLPEGRFPEFRTLRRPPAGAHILLGHSEEGYLFAGGHYSAVTADGANETAVRSLAFGGIGHLFVVVLLSVPELDATVARVARAMKSAADGTLVSLWPNKRRRVTLPVRPITHEIALRSAELGVVLGMREPTAPDLQAQGRLMARYPTPDTIRKQLRPATRTHLPPEARR